MVLPPRLVRWLRSTRAWIALGVLAPLGMLVMSGLMLLDLRRDAWDKADQTSRNLLQVVERDIARNIELIDLSIQATVDNLKAPGVAEATPQLRQLILFDRAVTARDLGDVIVVDENGNSIIDAGQVPARKKNYADRAYFQAHKENYDLGLYISRPLVSRLTGARVIALSRRINKLDGTFGGIVVATLRLTYFSRLFHGIDLGQDGAINIYLRDGTRLMRHPYNDDDIGVNIAGTRNFERFVREQTGSFVGTSVRDKIERHYTFTRVGDLPILLNVALSTREIEAEWRIKAVTISVVVIVLCSLTILLVLLYERDLRRRAVMQAELARLSLTDPLTGLPNRRRFEEVSATTWDNARRTEKPLAMLVVDADHFKRCNDRYGHAVGDEVLKGLANCLTATLHRPYDFVARIGGEEFVVILPDTDADGALYIAGQIHEAIATFGVPSAGIHPGAVTVSIGLAIGPRAGTVWGDLYKAADAGLYAAKEAGRNCTRSAVFANAPVTLRLVNA